MNTTTRNRHGSGLMMVIVLGMAAMILVLAAISFAYGSLNFAATRTNYINSLMLAETALNETIRTVHLSPTSFTGIEKVPANPGYTGQELVDWLWKDAPGLNLDDDKKMCLQEGNYAIGVAQDGEYVRACRVKFAFSDPPTMPAAMYIHANNVVPQINGASTKIDGNDYDALSKVATGPGPDVHGIATSTAVAKQSWIDIFNAPNMKNKKGAISGVAVSPDVENLGAIPQISDIIAIYEQGPTIVVDGETHITGAEQITPLMTTWGTPDAPEIVLVKNEVFLNGNLTGCGVLIIEGSLELKGNFQWQGIVIVKGNFTVGQGSAEIWGAMVVEDPNATVNVQTAGSFDLRYSTEAISFIRNAIVVMRDSWEEL